MGRIQKVPNQLTHAPKKSQPRYKKKNAFDSIITNTELNERRHPSILMNCAFVLFGYNNLGEGGAFCHENKFVIPCLKVKITVKARNMEEWE